MNYAAAVKPQQNRNRNRKHDLAQQPTLDDNRSAGVSVPSNTNTNTNTNTNSNINTNLPAKTGARDLWYAKKGWVNLATWKPAPKTEVGERGEADERRLLDFRLREAAATMRWRWDRWNADHGVEYDYDRECSCSDGSSDDDGEDGGYAWAGDDDAEFDRDYQYIKKTTLVFH